MTVLVALHLVLGMLLGALYFGAVWWSVRRFGAGTPALAAIVVRFALLAGALGLVSLEGPVPLLATAAGVLGGRFFVLRHVRGLPA